MNPTVTLTTSYPVPPGTVRATTLSQIFRVTPSLSQILEYPYHVGIPSSHAPKTITIRNNAVNINVAFTVELPSYLKTESARSFTLPPLTERSIVVIFDESKAKSYSRTRAHSYRENIEITVLPINDGGPVFIKIGDAAASILPGERSPESPVRSPDAR